MDDIREEILNYCFRKTNPIFHSNYAIGDTKYCYKVLVHVAIVGNKNGIGSYYSSYYK
jgi:hypothetical protein